MPDVPVTLVPWFDAKNNPPEAGRVVLTDEGMARSWPSGRVWEFDVPDMEGPCKPSVWCDPSPPDMSDPLGPLTAHDLRRVAAITSFAIAENGNRCGIQDADGMALLARLRRALDQIGNT